MYLNVIQLAESFGVAEGVVEGWIRTESLPCIRDGGRLLFDRAQVAQWAAERGLAARAGFLAPGPETAPVANQLQRWLAAGGIWRDVAPAQVRGVVSRVLGALPGASPAVRQLLAQRAAAPGGITWAPVGDGFALPHLRSHAALGRDAGVLALLLLSAGADLDGDPPPDGVPVTRLLFFMAPSPRAHLDLLAQLSGALLRGSLRQVLRDGADDAAIVHALAGAESRAGGRGGGG